jgi:hypothetical protein
LRLGRQIVDLVLRNLGDTTDEKRGAWFDDLQGWRARVGAVLSEALEVHEEITHGLAALDSASRRYAEPFHGVHEEPSAIDAEYVADCLSDLRERHAAAVRALNLLGARTLTVAELSELLQEQFGVELIATHLGVCATNIDRA